MTTELLPPPSSDARRVLTELFAPLTPEEFFDEYWDRKPLHLSPGPGEARAGWFDTRSLIEIITQAGVSAMDVRMAQNGAQLDVERYSSRAFHHDWSSTAILDANRVLDLYDEGVTILLESLDRYHPPTARRARALERCFGCTLKSNAFLTPDHSNAFPLHNDTYDGLIVQLQGRKHWDLYAHPTPLPLRAQRYEPGRDEMGELLLSVDLEPGDLLYVPRGVIHRAEAIGEDSLHLTLIPVWTTWYEVLEGLLREVGHHEVELRRGLGADALGDVDALLERLMDPASIDGCFDRLRDEHVASRRPLIPRRWEDMEAREALTDDAVVRARPESLVALCADGERGVRLSWLDRKERFDAALEPTLRRLLSGEPARVGSLPGPAGATARREAATTLMSAGLLGLETTP